MIQYLGNSADRAKSIGQLAEELGQSRRQVEKALEELVQTYPIVACPRGIYVAQTPQEARAYAQSLRGRIVAVQARITALETWAEIQELSGQEAFPWAA